MKKVEAKLKKTRSRSPSLGFVTRNFTSHSKSSSTTSLPVVTTTTANVSTVSPSSSSSSSGSSLANEASNDSLGSNLNNTKKVKKSSSQPSSDTVAINTDANKSTTNIDNATNIHDENETDNSKAEKSSKPKNISLAVNKAYQPFKEMSLSELELGETIAAGATATVYKAKRIAEKENENDANANSGDDGDDKKKKQLQQNAKPLAVKIFHIGIEISEWRQEIYVMSVLDHPNVVRLLGMGTEGVGLDAKCFIVSELFDKGSLYQMLYEEKAELDWPTKCILAKDLVKGVEYLHSQGIMHRDIKSGNCLITDDIRLKVTDFGTCRLIDKYRSNLTGGVGTAAWMAPEVLNSVDYTEKADIYSTGMVLYEIFEGEEPFKEVHHFHIPTKVGKGERPKFKKAAQQVRKIIKSAWHAKPHKRPTATKLLSLLDALPIAL